MCINQVIIPTSGFQTVRKIKIGSVHPKIFSIKYTWIGHFNMATFRIAAHFSHAYYGGFCAPNDMYERPSKWHFILPYDTKIFHGPRTTYKGDFTRSLYVYDEGFDLQGINKSVESD